MPRASAAAAIETGRRILERATALFASRGFAAVSLDDVSRDAGVTRGAVYHHYGSKRKLFGAVADMLQAQVAGAVVAAAEKAGSDARDQLRAGSHAFLDAVTVAPAVRVLLIDAPAVLGWKEWRRLDEENSAAHLREALQSVGLTDDVLDATTAQLSGAMNEAALWIALHENIETARTQSHAALDRLLDAYLR
jgi:AcrR family transcriptional regulator